MGSGASAIAAVQIATHAATEADLKDALAQLPRDERKKLEAVFEGYEAAPEAVASNPTLSKEEAEDEFEEDEMDDAEFERQAEMMRKKAGKGHRAGVMAENDLPDENWKAPVNDKTPEQRARIEAAVARPQAFMFHGLGSTDLETVIMAFMEHQLEPGTPIIKQGDNVDPNAPGLYVIESGELDVFKMKGPEEEAPGQKVFTYPGQGQFGELALLYNAPRAATVIAASQCIVWSIDRNTFNVCVKQAAMRRGEKYEAFLASVDLLSGFSEDDRAKVADVLKEKTFAAGDSIITKGEVGQDFFFLEEGSAEAREGDTVVKTYGPKEYFGELALIKEAERAVDVIATSTPTKVVSIDRSSFLRLLGPLEDTLKEKAKDYTPLAGA